MIDKTLVQEKMEGVREYLQEIEGLIALDAVEILKDFRNLKTLERNFQLIVDEIIDINLHFIQELELKTPDDFQNTFTILSEQTQIFPQDFAMKISPVVGLRNMLVHRYEKVDRKFFIEQMKKEYADFVEYLAYIDTYLKNI
ncbi:MAG TPA: DUF86 domain-containing protein [Candidatus Paceibacterota bacterium]